MIEMLDLVCQILGLVCQVVIIIVGVLLFGCCCFIGTIIWVRRLKFKAVFGISPKGEKSLIQSLVDLKMTEKASMIKKEKVEVHFAKREIEKLISELIKANEIESLPEKLLTLGSLGKKITTTCDVVNKIEKHLEKVEEDFNQARRTAEFCGYNVKASPDLYVKAVVEPFE